MLNNVSGKIHSGSFPVQHRTGMTAPQAESNSEPSLPTDRLSTQPQLDSKEFKMLLDPSKFKHVPKALDKLRDKVSEAAEETGRKLETPKKEEVRTQDIIFLDTEDHALKDQGYILRYRDIHGGSKDDNLTLKFRDNDAQKVAGANVDAAEGLAAKPKFELDETFQDTETSVFSKSNKVKVPHLPATTVENMTEYFPHLGELGLAPDTKLKKMHGGDIVEERYLVGNVKVGKHETAPAYLTLWYDDAHQETPAVAEFSFAHGVHDTASGVDQTSEEMMRSLHDNAPKWLSHGSTKTNFAYSE